LKHKDKLKNHHRDENLRTIQLQAAD
ncbi:MAG: hypothetical protein RLZZ215_2684, partial [Pseudomonadota bacterium]